MSTQYGQAMPAQGPTCPRHPDRVSYVTCQRCGRPTCPDCQVAAAVGVHCVDCAAAARRETPARVRQAQVAAAGGPRPIVTYALTGVIVVVYLLQIVVPVTTAWLVLVPAYGWVQPWRLLSNALAHDPRTALHLIGNAFLLVVLGRVVEPWLGTLRYGLMCLFSALGGTAMVLWTTPTPTSDANADAWFTPYLGISTVGYGLMCALVLMELRRHGNVRSAATLLLLNVGFSLAVAHVSWMGHLGGGLAGGLTAAALTSGAGAASPRRTWLVGAVGLAVLVALLVGRYAVVPPSLGGFGA